jgi:hypothetical protein
MSLFSSRIRNLFADTFGIKPTIEWEFTITRKIGKKWQFVHRDKITGLTIAEAMNAIVTTNRAYAGERVAIGGNLFRVWATEAGTVWTVVDTTPRGQTGDRARERAARAAALRAS